MNKPGSCPRDGTPLELRIAGPSAYELCPKCNGMRFEEDALRLYLEDGEDSWNLPDGPGKGEPAWDLAVVRCPCGAEMRETRREGVKIDICPECRSVWLDGGEIAALRRGPAFRPTGRAGDFAFKILKLVTRALEWV